MKEETRTRLVPWYFFFFFLQAVRISLYGFFILFAFSSLSVVRVRPRFYMIVKSHGALIRHTRARNQEGKLLTR